MPKQHHTLPTREVVLDLRKFRYLVAVVDEGGFRRAAQRLNVAQPAMTRQVRALEADIGLSLIERSRSGIKPTTHGVRFIAEAREILSRVDALRSSMKAASLATRQAVVRLGLPSSLAEIALPSLLQEVRDKHPHVHVICTEGSANLVEYVEKSVLDLAVVSVAGQTAAFRCHSEDMLEEQDYLVCPTAKCPLAPITIDELLSWPLVLTPRPNSRRQHLDVLCEERHVSLNIAAEAGALSTQTKLVLAGHGAAVLPFSAARLMTRTEGLTLTEVLGLRSTRRVLFAADPASPTAVSIVATALEAILCDAISPETGRRKRQSPASVRS
jgi:LysR family nitrogen assimilation transcriptional regulator